MKYKGKIIQIIEEKKVKGYILDWQQNVVPNHDYFNIRPAEEREVPKKYKLFWFLSILVLCTSMIIFSDILFDIGIIFWMSVILLALDIYIGIKETKKYINKFVPKGIWYFNDAFAVEKPHNYKVGDFVEIELNIRKGKSILRKESRLCKSTSLSCR